MFGRVYMICDGWLDVVYLFIQSDTYNIGHVNHNLYITTQQFMYYNTACNIWTSIQYNIINNNTKCEEQVQVESVSTPRNVCIYINIPKSYKFKLKVIIWISVELYYM
jgi:hypothetical protein